MILKKLDLKLRYNPFLIKVSIKRLLEIEITLLKVITYDLQTYSVGMEAGIVHAYNLILGLVEVGEL